MRHGLRGELDNLIHHQDRFVWIPANREKAAKILGIGERTLYRKIKEYNL